jgi:hypothetical protein
VSAAGNSTIHIVLSSVVHCLFLPYLAIFALRAAGVPGRLGGMTGTGPTYVVLVAILLMLVVLFASSWLQPTVAAWVGKAQTLARSFGRAVLVTASGAALMAGGVFAVLKLFESPDVSGPTAIPLFLVVWVGALQVVVIYSALWASLLWLLFVASTMGVFWLAQHLLAAMVESPKGPLLGLSGVATAVGAALRSWTP